MPSTEKTAVYTQALTKRAIETGKKIIDITLPLGWDEKHGGIIAFTDVKGCPPVQLEWDMKLWWPNARL